MKKLLKEYFTFSKKERAAVFILLLIIITAVILPYFLKIKTNKVVVDKALADTIAALQSRKEKDKTFVSNNKKDSTNVTMLTATLFYFDPNTLDAEGWRKLGLRERTIQTILNYTSKGGRFRNPEDIRKIWGLSKDEADRIIPYIRIEQKNNTYTNNKNSSNKETLFDVNTATVWQLKQIPTMGTSLPYRIVKYRERLGGFIAIHQVKEVYGMEDSLYNSILHYLTFKHTKIKQINLNTASESELSAHPYIDKSIAKAIVEQRSKNGAYKKVDELKTKIFFLTDFDFNRIAPYVTVSEN